MAGKKGKKRAAKTTIKEVVETRVMLTNNSNGKQVEIVELDDPNDSDFLDPMTKLWVDKATGLIAGEAGCGGKAVLACTKSDQIKVVEWLAKTLGYKLVKAE